MLPYDNACVPPTAFELMFDSFNQSAGGLVTLTRFKGACHSKQSEIRVLKALTCLLGSPN